MDAVVGKKKRVQSKAGSHRASKASASHNARKRANWSVWAGGNSYMKMWGAIAIAIVIVISVWISGVRSTIQRITEGRLGQEGTQEQRLESSLWQSVSDFQNAISGFKEVLSSASQVVEEEVGQQKKSSSFTLSDEQLSQLAQQIKEEQRQGALPQGYDDSQEKEDIEE